MFRPEKQCTDLFTCGYLSQLLSTFFSNSALLAWICCLFVVAPGRHLIMEAEVARRADRSPHFGGSVSAPDCAGCPWWPGTAKFRPGLSGREEKSVFQARFPGGRPRKRGAAIAKDIG